MIDFLPEHRQPSRPKSRGPLALARPSQAVQRLGILLCGILLVQLQGPLNATAELPDAPELLRQLGLDEGEIEQIHSGSIVRHSVEPASDRELTTAMAFAVSMPPGKLLESARRDLFDAVDPGMIAHGELPAGASAADFGKLELRDAQIEALRSAEPGGGLNLSAEELATFRQLGKGASEQAIEKAFREMLASRVAAYRERGLDGIAPYALSRGKTRSPADELKTATNASEALEKYAPAAYRYLLAYPKNAPPGAESAFRWSLFEAHGEPTVVLTQLLMVPDGEAWILAKRQYYVSTGYNAEQELAALLPSKDGGTVVVYVNRTSTDQVTGFGGSAKRSIGSKLLASQIEALFEKARARVE